VAAVVTERQRFWTDLTQVRSGNLLFVGDQVLLVACKDSKRNELDRGKPLQLQVILQHLLGNGVAPPIVSLLCRLRYVKKIRRISTVRLLDDAICDLEINHTL
jgi:hypothetical protein